MTVNYKGITLVPDYFMLAQLEKRLMLRWFLQSETDDIRFRLAKKRLDDRVQKEFDVVILTHLRDLPLEPSMRFVLVQMYLSKLSLIPLRSTL